MYFRVKKEIYAIDEKALCNQNLQSPLSNVKETNPQGSAQHIPTQYTEGKKGKQAKTRT